MARYTLYGSIEDTTSVPLSESNSFNMKTETNVYASSTKPLKKSNLDTSSKVYTTPSKIYTEYQINNTSISDIREKLLKTINIDESGAQTTFSNYTKFYNRFKLPTLNDAFQKGFAHVFFTRPDCNILDDYGTNLNDSFINNPEFSYAWKNNSDLVKQLSISNGQRHSFMLSLSNKAASFSTSDEMINTDAYGKTYKGWQIAYGRNNVESKAAGNFSITFNDDRTLHIYTLNKLWVDYISDVYQGKKSPKPYNILNKILDYASSCYYIITAEDGETIIFWTKYYGVFPSTIPSSQFSWGQGNVINAPVLDVTYQYSFKEDMNPVALSEFNMNANVGKNMKYVPTYDKKLGHVGTTWVGVPYIELVNNNTDPECPHTFKLRFGSTKDIK